MDLAQTEVIGILAGLNLDWDRSTHLLTFRTNEEMHKLHVAKEIH